MRLQKLKIVTGTMLSVLISAVAAYPAIARPVGESTSEQLLSQMDMNQTPQTTPGTENQTRPQTTPGTENQTTPQTTPGTQNQTTPLATPTTEEPVTGRIVRVEGEKVSLEMPDGMTQEIMIPQRDITRLNLVPGAEIAVQLDDQNRATSVNLATADTNRTTTTIRREEQTTQQRTTTETTPAQTPEAATETTPTPEAGQQAEETAPVRALW
ncbi:MAG: hypothetical protein AB1589_39335 [Cyanobacteriota bacterium]